MSASYTNGDNDKPFFFFFFYKVEEKSSDLGHKCESEVGLYVICIMD